MKQTPNLDALRALTSRLASMLMDPQPGLSTWHEALHVILGEIAQYTGHPDTDRLDWLDKQAKGKKQGMADALALFMERGAHLRQAVDMARGHPVAMDERKMCAKCHHAAASHTIQAPMDVSGCTECSCQQYVGAQSDGTTDETAGDITYFEKYP